VLYHNDDFVRTIFWGLMYLLRYTRKGWSSHCTRMTSTPTVDRRWYDQACPPRYFLSQSMLPDIGCSKRSEAGRDRLISSIA